jgi:hypothetical protein
MREQIGTIGADVDHEHRVAHGHGAQERRSRRDVDVELHDAVGVGAESKLAGRAQHAVRQRAANLSPFDLFSAGNDGARWSKRIELAGRDVRRAADDVEQLAAPDVDFRDVQMIGIGVRRFLDDARDHDRREVRAERDQLVDRCRPRRDEIAKLRGRMIELDEGTEPLVGDVHASPPRAAGSEICSRNLTSES